MKERFEYIDALRGWAILGVIITHVGSLIGYSGFLKPLVFRAGFGVQLFFMVSAFTIFYTLDAAKREDHIYGNFFIRRFLRIAPIYWLGIVMYTIVFGLDSRGWIPGPEIWHYPMHLFFVNLLHPETPSTVVPGGWSISCEMLFYLLCPLLSRSINSLKKSIMFSVLSILLGILFLFFTNKYALDALVEIYGVKLSKQFFYRNIISQLGCFSFGILLFHIYKEGSLKRYLECTKINIALLCCVDFLYSIDWIDPGCESPLRYYIFFFLSGLISLW